MTPKEMIAVLEAYERGEKIEGSRKGVGNWGLIDNPVWNFADYDYRIAKPEPKKVKLYALIAKHTGALSFYQYEPVVDCKLYWRAPQFDCEMAE